MFARFKNAFKELTEDGKMKYCVENNIEVDIYDFLRPNKLTLEETIKK